MILSHDWRFIFIKTGKTAGSSLELALSQICGPLDIITPLDRAEERKLRRGTGPQNYIRKDGAARVPRSDGIPRPDYDVDFFNHITAEQVREYVGPKIWRDYLKIGFVRNPWDRMVSAFHWTHRKQQDKGPAIFKRYLRGLETEKLSLWGSLSVAGALDVDFVGRYESLETEFRRLLDQIGVRDPLSLPTAKTEIRPSSTRDYRFLYDDEDRGIVAEHAARDIAEFGYRF